MQIDAAIHPSVAGPVTFLFHRSESEFGIYSLLDTITGTGTVTKAYLSSGPIGIPLRGDTYYLFGVSADGPHTTTVLENGAPTPASLGQMLGGFSYAPGGVPTIARELRVTPGSLGDDVALRIQTGPP